MPEERHDSCKQTRHELRAIDDIVTYWWRTVLRRSCTLIQWVGFHFRLTAALQLVKLLSQPNGQ